MEKKEFPLQGSQLRINLFGRDELVGFYNTFAPKYSGGGMGVEISTLPGLNELVAIKGTHFIGYQFHPESLLTQNGYSILQETVGFLLSCQSGSFTTEGLG